MKTISLIMFCLGIAAVVAHPQRVHVQKLPYYPPPTQAPRPILVKRSADKGPPPPSVSGNIYRGESNRIDAKVAHDDKLSSGSIDWTNAHGIGASVSRDINNGVSDSFSKSLKANLYNDDRNSVNAIYSQSHIKQDNGAKFDKTSGLLNWENSGGHGLNAGLSRFEGFGKQASANGYTNLFTSNDGNAKINAHGGASRWLSGPLQNQNDFGFGVGGSYSFPG